MRRGVFVLPVLLALAASAGAFARPAANPTVLPDCLGKPQTAPTEITLACGDGNESLFGIRWTGWGATFAAGLAKISIDDCKPNCAAGTEHDYPVVVVVSGRQTCKPSGKLAYVKVTIAFVDAKPHTAASQTFPCRTP